MGRKKETADEVLLREFLLSDDPSFVPKEIASAIDMSRQGVSSRLKELEDEGLLHSKKPGRDRIYWLTQAGESKARESLKD